MHIQKKQESNTKVTLTVAADKDELQDIKQRVLTELAKEVEVSGFRTGNAPLEMVEKQVDQTKLQQQFFETAASELYPRAAKEESIRPVAQPEISIKKFTPFSEFEFDATVDVLGDVKLPDYKAFKKESKTATVTTEDIDEVVTNLQTKSAKKEDVDRAAKTGDQVVLDFSGKDSTGEKIAGAEGTDYPLALGSDSFIPGFEENIVGLKAGEQKSFTIPFPDDYGIAALAGKEVTFDVTIKSVQDVIKPELNDEFAASVGPVKTMDELKRDIKKELQNEKQRKADMEFESELVGEISQQATLEVPQALIDEQAERMISEFKQNLTQRGQTMQEYLEMKGLTEEEHKEKEIMPQAEERVKASIVLAEVAEAENIQVTPEELDMRMQVLKGQYQDPQMQEELEKPEARREIASRMLSEKTVSTLSSYAKKDEQKAGKKSEAKTEEKSAEKTKKK